MGEATASPADLAGSLLLVGLVWLTLLLGQALLEPALGGPAAVLASFCLAAALVLATRRRPHTSCRGISCAALGLGTVAGFASYPLWIALVAGAGKQLGLQVPARAPGEQGLLLAAATLIVAPVFEELLYRERLLTALRRRFGAPAAVLASSAAFAVVHGEPWAMLGTFWVGMALAIVRCFSNTVAWCIGLHGGLNLAAWLLS